MLLDLVSLNMHLPHPHLQGTMRKRSIRCINIRTVFLLDFLDSEAERVSV
jgi:hypothetical protein